MAERKSPSKGSKPDKLMKDAIMLALHREAQGEDGKPTKKLNVIAAKLVQLAEGGDLQAIKEINDRVDGRPAQQINHADDTGEGPMKVLFKTVYETK